MRFKYKKNYTKGGIPETSGHDTLKYNKQTPARPFFEGALKRAAFNPRVKTVVL